MIQAAGMLWRGSQRVKIELEGKSGAAQAAPAAPTPTALVTQ